MDTHPSSDIENVQYTQLHGDDSSLKARHSFKLSSIIIASFLVIITLVCSTIIYYNTNTPKTMPYSEYSTLEERGVAEGVSAKSNHHFFSKNDASFNWTNSMFSWQRTAYHFQPEENFMNDPDGPLYYKGWYHIFYQYNPYSAVWGNITWGHAVSKDLIHWMYLPLAMVPDHWYDIDGVWTGSATLLPNGQIKMLYTGSTANSVQVQNLAYPANPSDPLLLDWIKYSGNPVLEPPSWIGIEDFRDPTTAWQGLNGTWRIAIGSRVNITTGITLVYQTTNFITYEFLNIMHAVPGTGMWECVDFFPVSTTGSQGLDTSANGPGIKHVLKASLDVTKLDYYAIGTYDPVSNKWTPDNPDKDVGIGWKVDYGRYYASKTFYDQYKKRRILWGWTNETDTENADLSKGWASLQTIPRTVVFDKKTGANILQWPVEELESLRLNSSDFEIEATPGSVIPIDLGAAAQLDITAKFSVDVSGSEVTSGDHTCGNGATDRTTFGPFGLLVIADDTLSELTPIYFRISNSTSGILNTYFCVDETRSSLAPAVFKNIYGDKVPVLEDEKLQMRVLVDHSMVESFAQEGRMVISSRIYPTKAIHGAARLFLFNNATGATIKASLKIWEMNSAFIHPFAFDQTQ